MVEEGLRNAVASCLLPTWRLEKKAVTDKLSKMRFNPDLVFNSDLAVGDVKYRLASSDWKRHELNQTVTFAAAFRVLQGVVVGFSTTAHPKVPVVNVGDFTITPLNWNCSVKPRDAAKLLSGEIDLWLSRLTGDLGPTIPADP